MPDLHISTKLVSAPPAQGAASPAPDTADADVGPAGESGFSGLLASRMAQPADRNGARSARDAADEAPAEETAQEAAPGADAAAQLLMALGLMPASTQAAEPAAEGAGASDAALAALGAAADGRARRGTAEAGTDPMARGERAEALTDENVAAEADTDTRARAGAFEQSLAGADAGAARAEAAARAGLQAAAEAAAAARAEVAPAPPPAAASTAVNSQAAQQAWAAAPTPTPLPAVSASVQAPVGSTQWRDEFSASVSLLATQRVQSAELRMQPAELGPVQVQIRIEANEASIAFSSAHAETRQALESALPRLREMLEAGGLSLTGTSVGAESFGREMRGEAQARAQVAGRAGYPGEEAPAVATPRVVMRSDQLLDVFA